MISLSINAQWVRGFVGGAVYLDKDFTNSTFIGGEGGAEFRISHLFKPEIGVSFLAGALEDAITRNDQGIITNTYRRTVSAFDYSFCPKIVLGSADNEVGVGHFQIAPKYFISKIEARGNFSTINQSNPSKSISEKEKVVEWQHSLGIGIGIDFAVSHKNYDSLSLNLYYQGIDLGNTLTSLKHSESKFSTKDVLGFGINYYFSFKKRLEPK